MLSELPDARRTTGVPGGVCLKAFSSSARPMRTTRCSSPSPYASPTSSSSSCSVAIAPARNRSPKPRRAPRRVDRSALDVDSAGVQTRQVEEVFGQALQSIDLFPHRLEELASSSFVEILVREQLEEAAEREER